MKRILFLAAFSLALAACHPHDQDYDATGTFEAVETLVPAQAGGVLTAYWVDDGSVLRAGQLVGLIDTTQLYLQKQELTSRIGAILSKTPDAAAELAALGAQLQRDLKEQTRVENLYKMDAATGRQLDDIHAAVTIDQKRLAAMESSLHIATSSLKKETTPVTAEIARLDDQLAKCRVVNPVTGTVLANYTEPHEMTAMGRPLYKIANLDTLILRAYITGDQFSALKLNQTVTVRVDAGKGYRNYPGRVEWISDKAEFTPKTIQTKDERAQLVYAVKIRVPNDGYLKIGMYGEVQFK